MKNTLRLLLITVLASAGYAHAASVSIISPTISFTLTDIQVGGVSATDLFDYEADGLLYVDSYFDEQFLFGGTGSTSGSSSSSLNGPTIDPEDGAGPLAAGDTLTMTLNSQATANTGFVNRNQYETAEFGFYNYTDDSFGNPETLSFLFDYTVTYATSLTNDVAGDQAFVEFDSVITLEDYDTRTTTTIELFPSGMDDLFELSFAAGTVMPGDTRSGSFSLDLEGGYGYFYIESIAKTPTNINVVPVPAAVWLFGSGLLGLIGLARGKAA